LLRILVIPSAFCTVSGKNNLKAKKLHECCTVHICTKTACSLVALFMWGSAMSVELTKKMSISLSDENQQVGAKYLHVSSDGLLGSPSSYADDMHLDFASLVTSISILQTS